MARTRTLVLVLAGGKGGRLELLTRQRAKPAVPYAGTHRLIDFPLSNCTNSGLEHVWVAQQFNPISLSDHLSNGRPWDLDRTRGGLLLLNPRLDHGERGGFHSGTADSLWRNAPLIREFAPETLVVLSSDAVYAYDYAELVAEHRESGADVTMVTYEVSDEDAPRYGVVQVDGDKVTDYQYKPEEPATNRICNEVFAFDCETLLDRLEAIADEQGEEALEDLGDVLLPQLVEAGTARHKPFDGYWRDVGTIPAYYESHRDLLGEEPPIDLDDMGWPILTHATSQRSSARIAPGTTVDCALIAPGAHVAGTVERTVIGRGAVVEEGAVVRDCILLPGSVVRAGATVDRAILDDAVEIGADATVGEPDGDLALLGLQTRVEPGETVPAGARVPEVEDD